MPSAPAIDVAGPSDYWRRSPSPDAPLISPPQQWREAGTEAWPEDLEDGPYDEWTSDKGSGNTAHPNGNGNSNGYKTEREPVSPDLRDEMEFSKRLEEIRRKQEEEVAGDGPQRDEGVQLNTTHKEASLDEEGSVALEFPLPVSEEAGRRHSLIAAVG
jgi:hypothetical protein